MPPDSTCERGRWFRDPCSVDDDADVPQVSPLRWLRCAPVEMTGDGNWGRLSGFPLVVKNARNGARSVFLKRSSS